MFNKFLKLFILFNLFIFFGFSNVKAATPTYERAPTASEVLIVYNSAYTTDADSDGTQDSQQIAEYYVSKRPGVKITSVSTETGELISRTNYNSQIRDSLEEYMTTQGIADSIKFIVLVKGIPLKITTTNGVDPNANYSSVDAAVCLLYEGDYEVISHQDNPYYNVDEYYTKVYRFKTSHFTNDEGVSLNYLVTRIDAFTVLDMKAIVDRGVAADQSGNGYWIIDDGEYNNMGNLFDSYAINEMNLLGKNVNSDYPDNDNAVYITDNPSGSVMGYMSWGYNAGMGDGYVSNIPVNSNYLNFSLLNGAVFSTYESFNAYGFVGRGQVTGHGQIAEWIEIGGSGGIGNVFEPYVGIAREDIWMPEYAVGYTWAEAAYMSLLYMDHTVVVVGDPLMIITELVAPEASGIEAVASKTTDDNYVDDYRISLSWDNPGDADFEGVKVVRKEGSYPGHIKDGVEVYDGTAESYLDTGLESGTEYYYGIFAYDEVPNYPTLDNDSKIMIQTIVDVDVPNSVSNISVSTGNHYVMLYWTNPTNSDLEGVKVVRKEGSYPSTYDDGTLVYDGTESFFVDSGLDNHINYYYAIFAYDNVSNYSSIESDSKIKTMAHLVDFGLGLDVSPPRLISGTSFTPSNGQVSISWTNPSEDDFYIVKILRREDRYSQSFSDGKLLINTSESSYIDTDVSNETTYFYTIFTCDIALNCSLSSGTSKGYATPCNGTCSDSSPEDAPSNVFSEPDIAPPSISSLQIVSGNGQATLSWDNSDDSDFIGSVVIRKEGAYPGSRSDGLLVTDTSLELYTDTNLSNGTTYYYGVFAYDINGNYASVSDGSKGSVTPSS